MPFAGDIVLPDDAPHVVKRGRRTTATGTFTTTEVGVLRVDDIPVRAGYSYRISTSGINLDASVANDAATARIRIAFSASTGTSATTSSTQIAQMRNTSDNDAQSNVIPLDAFHYPGSTGYLSVLLSAVRVAGSGNYIVFCSGTEILDLVIEEVAEDPGDTGVVI